MNGITGVCPHRPIRGLLLTTRGAHHCTGRGALRGVGWFLDLAEFLYRLPDPEQKHNGSCGHQRGDDIGQRHGDVVGGDELGESEGDAGDDGGQPRLPDPAFAVHHEDQDQGHDHRQQRRLPSDHAAERVDGETGVVVDARGHRGQRDDGGGQGTECDRCGVRDQRHGGGLDRLEPQREQHHHCDGDRGAEAGQGLEQRTEAERDDDRLDPVVGADPLER